MENRINLLNPKFVLFEVSFKRKERLQGSFKVNTIDSFRDLKID